MPRARLSYGLLTSQNQGGGNKKQGLPPTVGKSQFSFNIKAKAWPAQKVVDVISSCAKADISTVTPGKLTIATGEPAYEPWVIDDMPETGNGFESAVAYAVAKQLGFDAADVIWIRTTFDAALAPGAKDFDFNLQQYSITEERKNYVDFSTPYYNVPYGIVSFSGSKIEGKTSFLDAKIGFSIGIGLDLLLEQIGAKGVEFNTNEEAIIALNNREIDGFIINVPSAYYASGVEVNDGIIVGQFPVTDQNFGESFGLLLSKGSKLTACVSKAVDTIRADGTLAAITEKWIPLPLLNL
jgi:polar amino acid transport system substrate-binding protein